MVGMPKSPLFISQKLQMPFALLIRYYTCFYSLKEVDGHSLGTSKTFISWKTKKKKTFINIVHHNLELPAKLESL